MAERALIVVNPRSRGGGMDLEPALAQLRDAGWTLVMAPPTTTPQELRARLSSQCAEVDHVVLAGGDGTLHAAAPALLGCGKPFGVFPMGTANDLARTLQLPLDPATAARVITEGRHHAIDLGVVNGELFFNVAHIGLGTAVTRSLTREVKRRWGPLAYARTLLAEYRSSRPFSARIACGMEHLRLRSMQIAVGNGRYYGGGATVAQEARIDDGELFLYSLPPQPAWRLAGLLPRLRRGTHGDDTQVLLLHGSEIVIETAHPMPITTDGEIHTQTPAHFSVLPRALTAYVPEGYVTRHVTH